MHTLSGIHTLGLTGGIGSGKSYVASLLRERGIPVYDSDHQAKELYDSDEMLKQQMIQLIGAELYQTESGRLNRPMLASLIFTNPSLLASVNALVHPALRQAFTLWREELHHQGQSICAIESALLLEGGLVDYVDSVCLVQAPEALRLERAISRDGASREQIVQRMSKQRKQEELLERADFVIHNDGAHPLAPQIDQLLVSIAQSPYLCAINPT